MKFIRDLMSRKSKDVTAEVAPFEDVINYRGEHDNIPPKSEAPAPLPRSAKIKIGDDAQAANGVAAESAAILEKLSARMGDTAPKAEPAAAANIWDIDDENDTVPAAAAPAPRRRRNKTRVLGFDGGDADVVSMFDSAAKVAPAERSQFPVGWILVDQGHGRGECFTLEAGMNQIGRSDDQSIQLDFGDASISRSNHAAIVYDPETHAFTLGHGGKKNIVRLNGGPVISNEPIKTGDKIKIGETTLHFVSLCSDEFNWAEDGDTEENDNVAIA